LQANLAIQFIRCNSDGQLKYALCNAPEGIPFSELCKASIMRWPIEQCFKEGKGQTGMDHSNIALGQLGIAI
jgi:hypothetical protein